MSKNEFLQILTQGLRDMPAPQRQAVLAHYTEAIDDRVEEGLSEEQAVADLGPMSQILATLLAETPPTPQRSKEDRVVRQVLTILLAVVVWSNLVGLWIAAVSTAIGGVAALVRGIFTWVHYGNGGGMMVTGAGLFVLGLGIAMIVGCTVLDKLWIKAQRKLWRGELL